MSMDKVPGSANPPSPLINKGYNPMDGLHTQTPKMDYAMGNPGQITSPVVKEGDGSTDTTNIPIGNGVQGVMNTEQNAGR